MKTVIYHNRFATEVDDVINSVMFLLSDVSAMTTGSTLAVDGGFTNITRVNRLTALMD
uniref:SDR family oxidoreductase n=1 Tax=Heterorhabditis bacteriophora TaxID=37862 RepID=A0A1I7XEN2_HETBA